MREVVYTSWPTPHGTKHRVVRRDIDESVPGDAVRQAAFMRSLLDTMHGLCAGPLPAQRIVISHDGVRWIAVLEAEEENR